MTHPPRRDARLVALLVSAGALAVAVVFGAALGHPFLPSNDDGPYIVWNPVIRSSVGAALRGAFTTTPLEAWAPLHILSHVLDRAIWGEWAGGYVLVNLVLHALNAGLTGWLVLRLGGPRLAAGVAALVFAVHPVQVESVVWISQRKTVLSTAFLLAALHLWVSYARAAPGRRAGAWALSFLSTAAALLTKSVAVIAPVALALLDVPLGRLRARLSWVAEKLPFALVAAAMVVVTAQTKSEGSSTVSLAGHTRIATAGGLAYHGGGPLQTFFTVATVLPRYLRLLAWPADLSIVYLPPVHTRLDLEVALSLALLALLAGAGALLALRAPRAFAWYAVFFLGLLPVSQLVPQVTLMNDRYLYVPMIGAAALAGEAVALGWARLPSPGRAALGACAAAALLALSLSARARVPVWRSDLALWTDAAAKAPRSPTVWYNLARVREGLGDADGALDGYLRAIALDDREADALVNAGAGYLRRGELERAAPLVERGAQLAPDSVEAQFNLALLRLGQHRPGEAEAALVRARSADPRPCEPTLLLAQVLAGSGREVDARRVLAEAAARGCALPGRPDAPGQGADSHAAP